MNLDLVGESPAEDMRMKKPTVPFGPPPGTSPPYRPRDYRSSIYPMCLFGYIGDREVHTSRVFNVKCDDEGRVIAETYNGRYVLELMPVDIPALCHELGIPLTP